MVDRVSTIRENPGIRNASWNRKREGVQPIQEIAGAREWVEPKRQRDDSREGTGLEPLPVVEHAAAFAGAREQSDIQLETFSTGTSLIGIAPEEDKRPTIMGRPEFASCDLCRRRASECAVLVPLHNGHICDQCTEQALDLIRAELPKRRLRLALERMMQGEVTEAMVAEVERLTGGKV